MLMGPAAKLDLWGIVVWLYLLFFKDMLNGQAMRSSQGAQWELRRNSSLSGSSLCLPIVACAVLWCTLLDLIFAGMRSVMQSKTMMISKSRGEHEIVIKKQFQEVSILHDRYSFYFPFSFWFFFSFCLYKQTHPHPHHLIFSFLSFKLLTLLCPTVLRWSNR